MKKFSLVSLAIAASLALAPAALLAQCTQAAPNSTATVTCYSFSFTSANPTIDISGLIGVSDTENFLTYNGNTIDYYDIVSFNGNYSGPGIPFATDNVSLFTANGWGSYTNENFSVSGWEYDNVFYPEANAPGTNGAYFDVGGLFFTIDTTPPSIGNVWAGDIAGEPGSPGTYTAGQQNGGSEAFATGIGINGTALDPPGSQKPGSAPIPFALPEYGAASMLGLCILCLVGVLFFKVRKSSLLKS
jgi:hypothetical protein